MARKGSYGGEREIGGTGTGKGHTRSGEGSHERITQW